MQVEISLNQSVDENAATYFELAKKPKRKLEGAKKALEESKKKLAELRTKEGKFLEEEKEKRAKVEIKHEWYEKFKWFFSSDGQLVICGRDATSNDIIVKKYTDKDNPVFHTEMPGSPFCVIKADAKDISEQTIKETAQFCASHSRAWERKLGSTEVYWVKPEQIRKELGLPKGSFMVYGKRNYSRPSLDLAVGVVDGDKVMCGAISVIKKHCKHFVIIKPGDEKKSDTAKKIKSLLEKKLEITLNIDEIVKVLPSGGCQIVKE